MREPSFVILNPTLSSFGSPFLSLLCFSDAPVLLTHEKNPVETFRLLCKADFGIQVLTGLDVFLYCWNILLCLL